jgi:VanZ family protein
VWSAWLPVATYAALIFTLSSIPTLSPPGDLAYSDKVAHFVEYAILGGLLARAWGRTLEGGGKTRRIVLALALGATVGALDELFQGTVGRNCSIVDWGADITGASVGVVLDAWSRRKARTPHWLWRRSPADERNTDA